MGDPDRRTGNDRIPRRSGPSETLDDDAIPGASTVHRTFGSNAGTHADLGRLVTEGRRKEFAGFRAFTDPAARARIPDPQAEETFQRSRLVWPEVADEPHAGLVRLYQALISLRKKARIGALERGQYRVADLPGQGVAILLAPPGAVGRLLVVACLQSPGPVDLEPLAADLGRYGTAGWRLAVSTEEAEYVADPLAPDAELSSVPRIRFRRAGAMVLRDGASESS